MNATFRHFDDIYCLQLLLPFTQHRLKIHVDFYFCARIFLYHKLIHQWNCVVNCMHIHIHMIASPSLLYFKLKIKKRYCKKCLSIFNILKIWYTKYNISIELSRTYVSVSELNFSYDIVILTYLKFVFSRAFVNWKEEYLYSMSYRVISIGSNSDTVV